LCRKCAHLTKVGNSISAFLGILPSAVTKNPLYFIQTDGIVGEIVQLGRARRLVRDLLSVFDCATIL
jgi:hypothetical protein